jgi:hypothetical protein
MPPLPPIPNPPDVTIFVQLLERRRRIGQLRRVKSSVAIRVHCRKHLVTTAATTHSRRATPLGEGNGWLERQKDDAKGDEAEQCFHVSGLG